MPLRIKHTQAARRDLREIWKYVGHDDGSAADRQLRRIAEVIATISDVPEMGRNRPDLGPSLRSFPVGRYIIFYALNGSDLNVVRVLDSARHITSAMFDT